MILLDIVKLKPGSPFKYKGQPAKIVWVENVTEEVGIFEDASGKKEMKYARHCAFYFTYEGSDGRVRDITHRSCWPWPQKLELKDYTL